MSIKFKNPVVDTQDIKGAVETDPVFVSSVAYTISQNDLDNWNGHIEDRNYLHTQSIASDSWTITHNLGKYPTANVIDSAGTNIVGSITYNSINQLTISFAGDTSGTATLN
jgi:hypothetical protein